MFHHTHAGLLIPAHCSTHVAVTASARVLFFHALTPIFSFIDSYNVTIILRNFINLDICKIKLILVLLFVYYHIFTFFNQIISLEWILEWLHCHFLVLVDGDHVLSDNRSLNSLRHVHEGWCINNLSRFIKKHPY